MKKHFGGDQNWWNRIIKAVVKFTRFLIALKQSLEQLY